MVMPLDTPDMIVFDSIAQSNLPTAKKSMIMQWYDRLSGGGGSQYLANRGRSVLSSFQAPKHGLVRSGAESVGIGGVLGAIARCREDGLDVKTAIGKVPGDVVLGLFALVAATRMKDSPIAEDVKTAGNIALGIYGYRKAGDLVAKLGFAAEPASTKSVIAGEPDGISRVAETL
jgi:hypothetical protein